MMIPTDAFVRFEKSQQIVTSAQGKDGTHASFEKMYYFLTVQHNSGRFLHNIVF
jgi:hypothetical protein